MTIYHEDINKATNIATLGSIGLLAFSVLASLEKIKDGTGFLETNMVTVLVLGGILLIVSSLFLLMYYHKCHYKGESGLDRYGGSDYYIWYTDTFLLGIFILLIGFIAVFIDFILPLP